MDDEFNVADLGPHLDEQRAWIAQLSAVTAPQRRDVVMDFYGARVWWAPWRRRLVRHRFTECVVVVGADGGFDLMPTEATVSTREESTVTEWPWNRHVPNEGEHTK